jgi:AraC-like DNA-binding protein
MKLIIEKVGKDLFGRIENLDFMPVSSAENIEELIEDIKTQIKEHQLYDEQDTWEDVNIDKVEFEICYDLTALFNRFDYLKITNVAEKAGMSPSLLRQYVSGVKYPSEVQCNKITRAVQQISLELADAVAL